MRNGIVLVGALAIYGCSKESNKDHKNELGNQPPVTEPQTPPAETPVTPAAPSSDTTNTTGTDETTTTDGTTDGGETTTTEGTTDGGDGNGEDAHPDAGLPIIDAPVTPAPGPTPTPELVAPPPEPNACTDAGGKIIEFSDSGTALVPVCQLGSAWIEVATLVKEVLMHTPTTAGELYVNGPARPEVPADAAAPIDEFCVAIGGAVQTLTDPTGHLLDFCRFEDASLIENATLFGSDERTEQLTLTQLLLPLHPHRDPELPTAPAAGERKVQCSSREGGASPALTLKGTLTVASVLSGAEAPISGSLEITSDEGSSIALNGLFDVSGQATEAGGTRFVMAKASAPTIKQVVVDFSTVPPRSPWSDAVKNVLEMTDGRKLFLDCTVPPM